MKAPHGIALAVATTLLLVAAPVEQGRAASAVAGSTEITQMANWLQLLDQAFRIARMAKATKSQLDIAKQQNRSLGAGEVMGLVTNTAAVGLQTSQLFFRTAQTAERYRVKHPGYQEATAGPRKSVKEIEQANQQLIVESLDAIDVQVNGGAASDQQALQALALKSESVTGTVQAIQVSHMFLGEVIRQLQQLRMAFLKYHEMTATIEGGKSQKVLYEEKRRAKKSTRGRVAAPAPARDWSGQKIWGAPSWKSPLL